jgi:hypothetical protein
MLFYSNTLVAISETVVASLLFTAEAPFVPTLQHKIIRCDSIGQYLRFYICPDRGCGFDDWFWFTETQNSINLMYC